MPDSPIIAFHPTRGYYIARLPQVPPRLREAAHVFDPPAGPWWIKLIHGWVGTPAGLLANFFLWFLGMHYFGVDFFMGYMAFSLFLPSAIVYRYTLSDDR